MPRVSGVVDKIYSKKGQSAKGKNFTRYSLSIDGEWYNHGFKAPDCQEGDTVEITYKTNDFGNEISNLSVDSESTGGNQKAKPAKVASGDTTAQIHRQNALRHATHLAIARGELDLSAIIHYANLFVSYIETAELPEAEEPVAPKKKSSKQKHGFEDVPDDVEGIV